MKYRCPVYINGHKSSLNRPWLERAACWKRQEVSSMLITHWNVATWSLPAFPVKSDYLVRWPNDRHPEKYIKDRISSKDHTQYHSPKRTHLINYIIIFNTTQEYDVKDSKILMESQRKVKRGGLSWCFYAAKLLWPLHLFTFT